MQEDGSMLRHRMAMAKGGWDARLGSGTEAGWGLASLALTRRLAQFGLYRTHEDGKHYGVTADC